MRIRRLIIISLCLVYRLNAAPGDIRVTVVDMEGAPKSSVNAVKVVLSGADSLGTRTIATQTPNTNGLVTFGASTIQSSIQGSFYFVIDTYVGTNDLRAHLYDPFGYAYTYIRYQTNGDYRFMVPVPASGSPVPQIDWNGTNSSVRFTVDLGRRSDADFWFTRVVFQKKTPGPNLAGGDYGLIPVVSALWLSERGYVFKDNGLSEGQIGTVQITRSSYDQSFLAKKSHPAGVTDLQYEIYLVNCNWRADLVGNYDPTNRIYTAVFDPMNVFRDTNAPAWDGLGMKDGVFYFATLQAQAWIWHSAGVSNGLAIDWGFGAAGSLWSPIRLNDQQTRLEAQAGAGGTIHLKASANAGLAYTLEYATNINAESPWFSLAVTNAIVTPFYFIDAGPSGTRRFYRLKQP